MSEKTVIYTQSWVHSPSSPYPSPSIRKTRIVKDSKGRTLDRNGKPELPSQRMTLRDKIIDEASK